MIETFNYGDEKLTIEIDKPIADAIDLMENTKNSVFVTGNAGVGKSLLIKYFRAKTKKKYVVLSFTGLAALNVDGQTIHSFFKFGLGMLDRRSIRFNIDMKDVLMAIDTIIIDEVSMARADIIDAINYSLKMHRNSQEPFGGVQMIFVGDLYQLSPVVDKAVSTIYYNFYKTPYFFSAKVFEFIRPLLVNLKKIRRQNDPLFIEILNNVRKCENVEKTLIEMNKRVSNDFGNLIEDQTVILATTNAKVAEINNVFLSHLKTEEYKFLAKINGEFDKATYPTDYELTLKVGAKVMFVKNDQDKRYVNGDIGIVTFLSGDRITVNLNGASINVLRQTWEKTKYKLKQDNGEKSISKNVVGDFTQFPLKLAWSVSIHKAQGQTFDKCIIDLHTGSFTHGQTYVALSRCRSLEGIKLKRPIFDSDIILDKQMLDYEDYFTDYEAFA